MMQYCIWYVVNTEKMPAGSRGGGDTLVVYIFFDTLSIKMLKHSFLLNMREA